MCRDIVLGFIFILCSQEHKHDIMHVQMKLACTENVFRAVQLTGGSEITDTPHSQVYKRAARNK